MKGMGIALFLLLITAGCVTPQSSTSLNGMMDHDDQSDEMMHHENDVNDGMMESDPVMNESSVQYVPFTRAAYNQAKAEGKIIFLEFYANWCPICKAQAPELIKGLSMIHSDKVRAFRVNYKDSDTDSDEAALAKEFNVTYQHTHILTDADGEVKLRSNEDWSADDVVSNLGDFS